MTGNTGLWQGRAEPSTPGALRNASECGPEGLYSGLQRPAIATALPRMTSPTDRTGQRSGWDGQRFAGQSGGGGRVDALGIAVAAGSRAAVGCAGHGQDVGDPGHGRRAGWPCEMVIASIREPSDFAGLPIVVAGGSGSPRRVGAAAGRAGRGLLFFDEISTAPPAVQAALLRVVLERTVGDLPCPPRSRWSPRPTRPSRPPTAGTCPRRWPTALPPGLAARPPHGRRGLLGRLADAAVPTLPDGWAR